MHILDKLVDEKRALVVSERDGIACKTSLHKVSVFACMFIACAKLYQFFNERSERKEVLLGREVEFILVLQIDWNCGGVSSWSPVSAADMPFITLPSSSIVSRWPHWTSPSAYSFPPSQAQRRIPYTYTVVNVCVQ